VYLVLAGASLNQWENFLSESVRLHNADSFRAHVRDSLFLDLLFGFEIHTDDQHKVVANLLKKVEDNVPFGGKTLPLNAHVKFESSLGTEDHYFEVNFGAGVFRSSRDDCSWHFESPFEMVTL